LFAGIFVVAVIGVLVEELLLLVERRTVLRWGMSVAK
ncbi:MAG TPA: ABC transporter permease, partial [Clostridiales bacterium]|nr:ABC transporter permease [Clostridiales bacterium]